jgi:acetyl esterase/lipase
MGLTFAKLFADCLAFSTDGGGHASQPGPLNSLPRWCSVYRTRVGVAVLGFLLLPRAFAQRLDPITEWATNTSYKSAIHSNIIYQKAGGLNLQLDVITSGNSPAPRPVVIWFHGGGWVTGGKEGALLSGLPYLARDMDFVDVDYRLASQAVAPAAVADGRCALHWVVRHAKEYGFDTTKIVVAGESAGGHLALMTGMLSPAAGFDNACEVPPDDWQLDGPKDIKVAAIVNFFGPIDLPEFLQPAKTSLGPAVLPMPRNFVLRWLGDLPSAEQLDLAKRLSPLTYVGKDSPPIITVHGEKDPYVPHEQAVRLHQVLDRDGVENQLVTVQGGGHGFSPPFAWTPEQNLTVHEAVFRFLEKAGVLAHAAN